MINLLLTIILLNVAKSLNCKPVSYESQSQKYVEVDWKKEDIGVMDACIWAIDPFGLERSEVTSSSLNGNQNMDRSVSPLRLRLTSIFLPPGASIWIFGTFDIDSEQITPSDPSVAVVG